MVTDERRSFHAARLLTVVRKPPRALSWMCTFAPRGRPGSRSIRQRDETPGEKSEYVSGDLFSWDWGAFYSINDFMQKALPPDFSNSEVSTMTGSSPSFCNVSPRLLVRWEVM